MIKYALQTILFVLVLIASGHAETIEKIVAVVNDKVITMSDLEEEVAIRRQLGEGAEKGAVLNSVIDAEIVSIEAGRLGIAVTMDEVTTAVLHFEETFSSKEEFNRFLDIYELNIQDLSRRFAISISVNKVREQKEAISLGRYEKWLTEARKKADIRIMGNGQ